MSEINIEKAYSKLVFKEYGIVSLKFKKQGSKGGADRICLCPGNHTFFIEFKIPGKEMSKHQLEFKVMMSSLEYKVYKCTSIEEAMKVSSKEIYRDTENSH